MKTKTVLLIEDDYLDVESVKRAFKKHQIDVNLVVAHNGSDGLAMLTGTTPSEAPVEPDVILLDINMPKMSGLEFLRIIRNYSNLRNIKTFIITTSGEEYDKIAARNQNVTGYIIKPLDFSNIKSADVQLLLNELTTAET
jgi:CheY-like chemotaxis protein